MGNRTDRDVAVGRFRPAQDGQEGLRVLCDAPELERHVDRPWFRAWAAARLGVPLSHGEMPQGEAWVGDDLLARHACVCGATGSGKTRLALRLLAEQIRAGCSVVMLDPKVETLRHLLQLAREAGVAPGEVTLLAPGLSGAGAPGWNPLDGRATGTPPAQAAADLVSVLARSTSSWGPRLQDLLTNALIVVAAHGLSPYELARLLQRDDYRDGLLRLPPDPVTSGGDPVVYAEARDYFQREFAAWGKAERTAAVAPVLNKFRELLRQPFLRALLCARRTSLDLPALWQRRGLVLVHMDGTALGDEGARLLGGLLAHQLLRTAMRASGPVPVVLALDEMGVAERFLGGALRDILAVARSRNLRLLVACQHLAQLSDDLRAALLANTAVQAFFRLGPADARAVASSLGAESRERVTCIAADVAKRDADGRPETWAEVAHTVRDGQGDPLRLSTAAWEAVRAWRDGACGDLLEGLQRLARVSGVARLYVRAADTGEPAELGRYVAGLRAGELRIAGPSPMRVVVSFPRPRLSVVSRVTEAERERRWAEALAGLPVRHAVLRLAGGPPGIVQVAHVPDPGPTPGLERFLSAAVAGSGQSEKEIEETLAWRRERIERVAGREAADEPPEGKALPKTAVGSSAPRRGMREPAGMPVTTGPPLGDVAGTVGEDGSLV